MILDSKNKARNVMIGDVTNSEYKILANEKMFSILSSKLYTDKIMAPIRELLCNAYDAHIAAGIPDTALEVHMPTSNKQEFRIRDFGKGLSAEDMRELYTTYGASTKNLSNDFIGCMGLGSKSPFAYTDTFTAISRYDGKRYNFACSLDNGKPNITQFPAEDMEPGEKTGLEVGFIVNRGDVSEFNSKLESFLRYFQANVNLFKDGIAFESYKTCVDFEFEQGIAIADNYQLDYVGSDKIIVYMGGVLYGCGLPDFSHRNFPLTREQYDVVVHASRNMGNRSFILEAEVGDVDVAASREHCERSSRTVNFVLTKLFNYLDSVEKDFLADLDKQNLADLEYCQRYHKFLQNKPFLSHKGLDKKIADCFNLCAYTDDEVRKIETATLPDGACSWRVIWTASSGSKRYKTEMRVLPRTLSTHQPQGTSIRWGNTKLVAMEAVMEGKIKFLQVPETRISPTLPPRTLDYFGDSAEIIMLRDDKQSDYLRKLGIKVATMADLPKPDPVVRVRKAKGDGEVKVEKEATHKALSTWRWVYPERVRGFTQYDSVFTEAIYLGSATGKLVDDLEDYVKNDKLILLPAVGTGSFHVNRAWFNNFLYPELKCTISKDFAFSMFTHLAAFLQQLGYGIVIKAFNSVSDVGELNKEIDKVTKKLGISSPVSIISKAVRSNIYTEKEFERKSLMYLFDTTFGIFGYGYDNALKATADAMAAVMDLPNRRKFIAAMDAYQTARKTSGLPTAAVLSVSSWFYSTSVGTSDHLFTDNASGHKFLYVKSVEDMSKLLHSVYTACDRAYPMVKLICNWHNPWPSRVDYIAKNRDKDAIIAYLEAMQSYNKKLKANSTQTSDNN